MLVLKRKEGQWVEIIHRSGDVIRVRVYDIQAQPGTPSRANLAFDDSARNFEIRREERRPLTPVNTPAAGLDPFAFRLDSVPEALARLEAMRLDADEARKTAL